MEMRAVPIYLRVSGVLVSLEGLTQELALGKSQLSAGYFKAYLVRYSQREKASSPFWTSQTRTAGAVPHSV